MMFLSENLSMLLIVLGVILILVLFKRNQRFKKQISLRPSQFHSISDDSEEFPYYPVDPNDPRKFVKVADAANNAEADVLKAFLEENGIEAFIRGYHHRGMLGFMGAYISLDILVPEERAEEAEKLLAGQIINPGKDNS